MKFVALVIFALLQGLGISPSSKAAAWKSCSEETGGGTCPDETTCCPTETPGVSVCIPLVHTDSPAGKPKGRCCRDSSTGCRFGYECAFSGSNPSRQTVKGVRLGSNQIQENKGYRYCKATDKILVFDPSAHNTPRYDLCRIREDTKKLYGFPVVISPDRLHYDMSTSDAYDKEYDIFHLAYFSNVGPITSLPQLQRHPIDYDEPNDHLEAIERAVIIIHGSLRDAEDYFCAGLSLIEGGNKNDDEADGTTMIIAPKFASVNDNMEDFESNYRFLVWDDQVEVYNEFLWHTWRYGSDAANAPISSYTALDNLIEHIVKDTDRFPNLQQVTIAGHSAGGQMLQRWALLSINPFWNSMNIRVVVANPRNYVYLDDRRWLVSNPNGGWEDNGREIYRSPTTKDDIYMHCPWYNHWLWGLEDGGELLCPYRDSAVAAVNSTAVIAQRYASRNVIYLSGEYDTVAQPNDHCGNIIQGGNRHERADRFYRGLQEYFGKPELPVHTFHTIPNSNHDHSLMFQSSLGRDAIFGPSTNKPKPTVEAVAVLE